MGEIIEHNGMKYVKVNGKAHNGDLVLAEFGEVVKVIDAMPGDVYCEDNVLLTDDEYVRLIPLEEATRD